MKTGIHLGTIMLSLTVSLATLSSCNKPDDKTTSTATTTTTTTTPSQAALPADSTKGKGGESDGLMANGMLTKVEAVRAKIKLGTMPDSQVILTVAGTPITIGQYRRMLQTQEEQIQATLSIDHDLQHQLVEDAHQRGISLTADEKKRLVETAIKAENASGGVIKKHLDSVHETTDEFNNYVLDVGLAFKAATSRVEQTLLHQLVDREILCAAARTNRFQPAAFDAYLEAKKGKAWAELLKTGLTADQLRDEIIQAELVKKMSEKIKKEAKVSDADVQEFYDQNKAKFKHGDLIRLSQIVIAAPTKDTPQQESMTTQIKKQTPSLVGAKLDAQVKVMQQHQRQRAEDLLARVLKGEDFAKLANEDSDDIPARAAKTGGDMGLQDKDHLLKEFADKVLPLKVGTVYPSVISSEYGFHIVKVTDKKAAGTTPFAELKDKLRQILISNREENALHEWLLAKRHSAEITVSPEFQALVSADSAKTKAH